MRRVYPIHRSFFAYLILIIYVVYSIARENLKIYDIAVLASFPISYGWFYFVLWFGFLPYKRTKICIMHVFDASLNRRKNLFRIYKNKVWIPYTYLFLLCFTLIVSLSIIIHAQILTIIF